jgi:hypothetical protein
MIGETIGYRCWSGARRHQRVPMAIVEDCPPSKTLGYLFDDGRRGHQDVPGKGDNTSWASISLRWVNARVKTFILKAT